MAKPETQPHAPGVRTDAVLAGKIGSAIRDAFGDKSQSEVARITGIDQPTLSKLVRGVRPTPLTVHEMLLIERASERPAGWILQRAGVTNPERDTASAIKSDHSIPPLARGMLLAALQIARASYPIGGGATKPASKTRPRTKATARR